MALAQPLDQLDAVDAGHAVVDDKAAAQGKIGVGQHRIGTGVEANAEALHLEGEFQGRPDGGIVIDEQYDFRHR